jgi:hypothetical protein
MVKKRVLAWMMALALWPVLTGCSIDSENAGKERTDPENTEEEGINSENASKEIFSSTFIDPYFDSNAQNIAAALDSMKNANINEVIVGWSAYHTSDSSSMNIVTAYNGASITGVYRGGTLTTSTFNTFVSALLEQAGLRNMRVFLGLFLDGSYERKDRSETEWDEWVAISKALSDDLYAKFGSSFDGWYIPCEPADYHINTSEEAALVGAKFGEVIDYIHTRNGNKKVIISPTMPTAILDNKTALQFLDGVEPILSASHADRWELQDGFMMTAWNPITIKEAFEKAKTLAGRYNADLRACMYTPVRLNDDSGYVEFDRMLEFVEAIKSTGTKVTMYQFSYFMDTAPKNDAYAAHAAQMRSNYEKYLTYIK